MVHVGFHNCGKRNPASWFSGKRCGSLPKVPSRTEGCPVVPAAGPLANLPVVMADSVNYVRCDFCASPELKSKMVFVSDPIMSVGDTNLVVA
jgi:hypothetical protein